MSLNVERHRLSNGLRVVLNPDHTIPTVAVAVYYDVGSRNEERGRSGFAHLFEHMMFQGSANVAKGEHFQLVMNRGGSARRPLVRASWFDRPARCWCASIRLRSSGS